MSTLHRLSDMNIPDDLLRADFYAIVIKHIKDPSSDVVTRSIRPDEQYRPDLVSYRLYSTVELRWLVSLVCDVEDESEPLPVGETYRFPTSSWLRREMRRFINEFC